MIISVDTEKNLIRSNTPLGLKLNIQKTKTITMGPITSCQIDGETKADYFGGLQKSL